MPSAAHLTVSLYLCSSEATHVSRLKALEGRRVSTKKTLQGSETETRELLGGTEEYSVSRTRCPFLAPLIFECLRPLWFLHYTRGRRDKVTLIFAKSVFHGFFPTSSVANFLGGLNGSHCPDVQRGRDSVAAKISP